MNKKIIVLVCVSIVAGAAFLCFEAYKNWKNYESASSAPKIPVSIGLTVQPLASMTYIAYENGYFGRAGLNVTLKKYSNGKLALDGLMKNEVSIATMAETPFALEASPGTENFKIAGVVSRSDDLIKIVGRADRGIKKIDDLRGKRVGLLTASASDYFLHILFLKHNIPPSSVTVVNLQTDDLPGALAKGDIDAFVTREPYVSKAENLLDGNVVVFSDPGLYTWLDMAVANTKISNNYEIVRRFLSALIMAQTYAHDHPDQAKSMTARFLSLDGAVVEKLWPELQFNIGLDQSLIAALEDEERWGIADKVASVAEPVNFLDYIYFDAMQSVKPEAINIVR